MLMLSHKAFEVMQIMAQKSKPYADIKAHQQTEKLRTVLKELPEYCFAFFIAIEPQSSILTRINYAYDLRLFFHYLSQERFAHARIDAITLQELDTLQAADIERYLEYLNDYEHNGKEYVNHDRGKARKLASLRSFFKYLFKRGMLQSDVVALVDMPKIRDRAIIRLDIDEVARILDIAESGVALTPHQQAYHQYTRTRDMAILTLFLGTGIRISECAGLNVDDVDFRSNAFRIIRKGGKEARLYFWDEIEQALRAYLTVRETMHPLPGHEQALFLSMQNRRMSVRAMQNLVKKYAQIAAPLKKISPHKLRSPYGTTLYRETGDIYLVADVLGHTDVNTTRKHYAAMDEDKRKLAARAVVLRDDGKKQAHEDPSDA